MKSVRSPSPEVRTVPECPLCVLYVYRLRVLRVFENRVQKKIFLLKRDDVTVKWRRLHNLELYEVYSSRNIIRAIKSRRMRWAGHVARMGDVQVHTGYWRET